MPASKILRAGQAQDVLDAPTGQRPAAGQVRAKQEPPPRTPPSLLALEQKPLTVHDADREAALFLFIGGRLRRENVRNGNRLALLDRSPLPRPERTATDKIREGVSALGCGAHDARVSQHLLSVT